MRNIIVIIVAVFVALTSHHNTHAAPATVPVVFNAQVQVQTGLYSAQNLAEWPQIAAAFAGIQGQLESIVAALTTLFASPADKGAFLALVDNCTVPAYATLQTDQPTFQQLQCCNVAHQRNSVVFDLLTYAVGIYFPRTTFQLPVPTTIILDDMDFTQLIDIYCPNWIVCAQEETIMIQECQLMYGQSGAYLSTLFNANYIEMQGQANAAAACLYMPTNTTGCASNAPLVFSNFIAAWPPNDNSYDVTFYNTCSTAHLAALTLAINTVTCG